MMLGGGKMNYIIDEKTYDLDLLSAISGITHMENEGHRYKSMFIIFDIAQRMRENKLPVPIDEAVVFADYGITFENGKITDWGNTDVDIWKYKFF